MSLRRFVRRLLTFATPNRAERELAREVRAHLTLLEDDFVARGMSRQDAAVAARRALGGVEQAKERHRDTRSFPWLEDLRRDVPYAVRGLVRSPGFSAAAVATLALGIGATTTVFSVVNAVLLQPLPYKDSDQLVRIVENRPARGPGGSPMRVTSIPRDQLQEWQARTHAFSHMMTFSLPPQTVLQTTAAAIRVTGAIVSADLLATFGAQPILGRTFAPDGSDAQGTVVISARAWARVFQSDPEIIGKAISLTTLASRDSPLDGSPREVIGVVDASFDFPPVQTDFWTVLPPPATPQAARANVSYIGRLADGVSIAAAQEEANVIGNALLPVPTSGPLAAPLPEGVPRFEVVRIQDQQVATVRPALRVLAAAVGVVLLIVCANIANLLLARGSARQREFAVRLAIGSGRGRIVRQLLTESLVLGAAGGVVGTLLAVIGVDILKTLASVDAPGVFRMVLGDRMLPRLDEVGIDATVLTFAIGVSLLTAIVCGVAPAWHMAHTDRLPAMGLRGAAGPARHDTRIRGLLVVGQLTLATMLLVGAGLLINSFVRLSYVDPGYEPARALTFYLVMPDRYPTARKAAVVEDVIARLRQDPRVGAAGFSYGGPILGVVDRIGTMVPEGRTEDEVKANPGAPFLRSVSHDYLQAMGVRLEEGRMLDARDTAAAPPVMLINRTVARQLFPGESPVGKFVRFDGRPESVPQQIVGVVADMRTGAVDQEAVPQMYIDYRQLLPLLAARGMPAPAQERMAFGFLSFAVRTDADPAALMPVVRTAISSVDPTVGIDAMLPMDQLVASSLTQRRFYATLLGVFAAIAVTLAAIGIYGVLAYSVTRRTQEIGVRMALGAQRGQVLRLVLRRGVLLTASGIVFGLAAAAALTRYLAGMLYGLTPLDVTTYAAVTLLFATVALLAAYLPARRATQVDPMEALRCE